MATVKKPLSLALNENEDENSRLRNGLNVNCLVETFRYLDTDDLFTLGTMSNFYKEIINDYIIRNHLVILRSYGNRRAMPDYLSKYSQFFEMYGKKITRISFAGNSACLEGLFNFVIRHCAKDQLKEIDIWYYDTYHVDSLEIIQQYFRTVEIFTLDCAETVFQLSFMPLLQSCNALRSLKLVVHGDISRIFNWPGMLNLRKLELVFGQICERTFIEFIQKRPKLEHFVSNLTFEHIDSIGNVLTKYCGDQICVFNYFHRNLSYGSIAELMARYDFLSKFTNLKTVFLSAASKYGVDLHRPLVAMAKNNTLKKLIIDYTYDGRTVDAKLDNAKMLKINMNRFTSLKSIEIRLPYTDFKKISSASNFLRLNATEMMPNVETVFILGFNLSSFSFAFIRNAPNLQKLWINNQECISQAEFCAKIKKSLESDNKTNENGKIQRFFKVSTIIRCMSRNRCDCLRVETSMIDLNFPLYA